MKTKLFLSLSEPESDYLIVRFQVCPSSQIQSGKMSKVSLQKSS